jgi:hypothetical protein
LKRKRVKSFDERGKNGEIKKSLCQILNYLEMLSTQVYNPNYVMPLPPIRRMGDDSLQVLELRQRQVEHYKTTSGVLDRFYFYVDGSEMGLGKTYIAGAHAITRKLPMIVICPASATPNWLNVCTTYGISLWDLNQTGGIITYETLRSRKGCQPRHGLLTRDDSGETPQFYATSLFSKIVEQGVLIIFDECQKLKNNGSQYRSAKALIRQLYDVGGISRAGFLSGTAMDKPEHAVTFMRLTCFIEQRNLYSKIQGQIRLEGIEDLYIWANRINSQALTQFRLNNSFIGTQKGSVDYVFNLFVEVIKPGIMSIMPSLELDKDIKNGYYRLDPESEQEYIKAIASLANAVGYNASTGAIVRTKENMGAITTSQIALQKAKMKAMARKAREHLDQNSNNKVILYTDYYDVVNPLLEILSAYNPMELTGRIKVNRRSEIQNLFQEHNNNHRLIIANPKVGGLSINLHDTNGNFPRFTYMMPGYMINENHQATGRTARDGLIGKATVRFFYGYSGAKENRILTALAKKGEVMQKVHLEQGAKFPNEYEDEYEGGSPSPVNIMNINPSQLVYTRK